MPPTKGVRCEFGDGKTRTLRYTARALDRLETQTGLGLGQLQQRIAMGNFRMTSMFLWSGLIHEEPELTVEDVLDFIDLAQLEHYNNAAADALAMAFGQPLPSEVEVQGKGEAAAARSTS